MRWIVALASAACLSAQEPRFGVRSPLVLVPVTVTDAKGRAVEGLEKQDLLVFDNGTPQRVNVDTFDTGVAPIALVIAVQSSGISAAAIEKVQQVGAMIRPLITGERGAAAVTSFDQRVTWIQDFTGDADLMDRALGEIRPLSRPGEDKEARMLDAVHEAIERLRARQNVRRVLLLISESRDRGSETTLEAAIVAAQSEGVAIYAATYSALKTAFTSKLPVSRPRRALKPKMPGDEMGTVNGRPPGKYNPYPKRLPPEQQVDLLGAIGELKRLHTVNSTEALAAATGGKTFSFTKQKALEHALEQLGAELHSQYVVSFAPKAPAPGYHRIEVRLARGGGYVIRARPGYWSTEERH
jgi:VWFA-related protein